MEAADLQQLFKQAPVHCMFLDPGMTVLDVCMKAGCFGRIGKLYGDLLYPFHLTIFF